jgi:alpha-ketoglutaric semialdehyde dehydrogenase
MLTGFSIVDGKPLEASHSAGGGSFNGIDPATGTKLEPSYYYASLEDLDRAANLAEDAGATYSRLTGRERGVFLRHIAAGIEARGAEIIERAHRETALPEARLKGELVRTANQLRLFAQVIDEGSWANARIDPAQPDRKPLPRADIRSVLRPLGPVAVFGSSNFPLAFSVAGGDTASALAAGNPVIVKAHSAHPGTSELMAQVVTESVCACGLPSGVFALLFGAGSELGASLVAHPAIKAVGFTGSLSAGKSLMKVAASRPEPIPCFMEMSSSNPLVVLPEALANRGAEIAKGLFGSFTLGVGQMCTKPGLVYLPRNEAADASVAIMKALVEQSQASAMLTETICGNHHSGVAARKTNHAVEILAEGAATSSGSYAAPALFEVSGSEMLRAPELEHEIFGPSTLVIRYDNRDQLLALLNAVEGQLTATVHGTDAEIAANADLIAILERKAGRLIVNGFPTGVEVCHAMVHGGPFPATSESRMTSVGTQAIYRFVRPVCYQDFPQAALPDELKNDNPLEIWRLIDGEFTRAAVAVNAPASAGKA